METKKEAFLYVDLKDTEMRTSPRSNCTRKYVSLLASQPTSEPSWSTINRVQDMKLFAWICLPSCPGYQAIRYKVESLACRNEATPQGPRFSQSFTINTNTDAERAAPGSAICRIEFVSSDYSAPRSTTEGGNGMY